MCPFCSDAAMMKRGCGQVGDQQAGHGRVQAGAGAESSNPLTRPCSFWQQPTSGAISESAGALPGLVSGTQDAHL